MCLNIFVIISSLNFYSIFFIIFFQFVFCYAFVLENKWEICKSWVKNVLQDDESFYDLYTQVFPYDIINKVRSFSRNKRFPLSGKWFSKLAFKIIDVLLFLFFYAVKLTFCVPIQCFFSIFFSFLFRFLNLRLRLSMTSHQTWKNLQKREKLLWRKRLSVSRISVLKRKNWRRAKHHHTKWTKVLYIQYKIYKYKFCFCKFVQDIIFFFIFVFDKKNILLGENPFQKGKWLGLQMQANRQGKDGIFPDWALKVNFKNQISNNNFKIIEN